MATEIHEGQIINDAQENNQVAIRQTNAVAGPIDFEPRDVVQAVKQISWLNEFKEKVLAPDIDFMKIPGTKKVSLLLPGAEKLAFAWKAMPTYRIVNRIEDHDREWTYKKKVWNKEANKYDIEVKEALGWFSYEVECRLIHSNTNQFMGSHIASLTSQERGREDSPAHVILMMAQKRAFIAAVRAMAFCSHIFTQDEDTFKNTKKGSGGSDGGGGGGGSDGFPSKYSDAFCGFCKRKHVQEGELITKTGEQNAKGKDTYGAVACRDAQKAPAAEQQAPPPQEEAVAKPDLREPVTEAQYTCIVNLIAKHEMTDERANNIMEYLDLGVEKGGCSFVEAGKYMSSLAKLPLRTP